MGRGAVVVEDDPDLQEAIAAILRRADFSVHTASTAADGLAAVVQHQPTVITVDLGLPDTDGLELCRALRVVTDAYIVVLTARPDVVVQALGNGADDYLTKPFSAAELDARISALLRRPRTSADHGDVLRVGDLEVDLGKHQVRVGDTVVPLTLTEYALLTELVARVERVIPYDDLLSSVWGSQWQGDEHLVQVHVGNLRRKLRTVSTVAIRGVRNVGYVLERSGTEA